MRIKFNDVRMSYYSAARSVSADGILKDTYAKAFDFMADLQPIGSKFIPAEYGIDSATAEAKKLFLDMESIAIGGVIAIYGKSYIVKALRTWYSHQEAIIEPYGVVLP
jgi:hypothetical protein